MGNCNVEYTDEFEDWWNTLSEYTQERCVVVVGLLEREGVALGFPYSSEIKGANVALRELRIQCKGDPYRILYAFDPARSAILLIGGCKVGNDNWYEEYVPWAERIFHTYLDELKLEEQDGRTP